MMTVLICHQNGGGCCEPKQEYGNLIHAQSFTPESTNTGRTMHTL